MNYGREIGRDMELRHLRYFIAVAEELHFGRAAERLFISQPPLSQQIQQLERELGFLLFNRTQRRVELTAAGQLFLDEARETLSGLEKAVAASRRVARGEVGWLGIGFVGTATYEFLPAVLCEFRAHYPDVELVLRELVSAKQAQALRDRRIHVGLARPAAAEEGIVSEALYQEPLLVALPTRHPLAVWERLTLVALAAEPFILFPRHPKPSYADFIVSLCEQAGFTPQVVQETAEIHTAISLVAAGLGVTLVPASVQSVHREGIAYRHFEEPQPTTELTAIHRAGETSPIVSGFLTTMRNVASVQRKC
jgi:DNA-binding transcriptional LysR family regulator